MKIVHVIGSKQGGGAESFFLRLTGALQAAGEEIHAICPPVSRIAANLDPAVARQHIAMRGAWDVVARWRIKRSIRAIQPAIVQTWMGRATRLLHLPNGHHPVHVARLGGYYSIKDYHHVHAWIGNTRGICSYLVRGGLPAARVFHIGNFADPAAPASDLDKEATRSKFHVPSEALLIVAAGRHHPTKGFDDLLRAFAALPSEIGYRSLRLLMAGEGSLTESLRQQATERAIADRVIWVDWQADIGPLLDIADVFVCPSRHEPYGNVILEAWAHRVPLVSTANEGALELTTHGENALLAPCHDYAALAEAVRLLLVDSVLRKTLGAQGQAHLLKKHNRATVVRRYRELYAELERNPCPA